MTNSKLSYENIKNFLIRNAITIAILIASITYLITGFVSLQETGKTIPEIIGESAIVFLFSYFVIQSFSLQGILHGENSKELAVIKQEFLDIKKVVSNNVSELSDWVHIKNKRVEYEVKDEQLCDYGITYQMFLEDNFDKSRFTSGELRKITRIAKKKITRLSPSELINYTTKRNDPLFLGKSKKNYLTHRNLSTLTSKIIFTLLFGYFTTSFIGFNIEEFIWKIIQVVMFLVFGIMEYFKSYMFMTGEYSEMLRKKTAILNEFIHDTNINKGEQ